MSSRSSNSAPEGYLPVGRIKGHRGGSGALTVRVAGGDAGHWSGLKRVWIDGPGGKRFHDVESCRPYADRLILKLKGFDDADAAAELRGAFVGVPLAEAPALEAGSYYVAALEGLAVRDETLGDLGSVSGVIPTGGTDVLIVKAIDGAKGSAGEPVAEELLIPLASTIVQEIDHEAGVIDVQLPEGLLEINAPGGQTEDGAADSPRSAGGRAS